MSTFDIVASAENNGYMQWQAMVFHYSCLTYHGAAPIIAVHHGNGESILPGFELIKQHGGRVQSVPNLRNRNGIDYAPRNTAAALRHVDSSADFVAIIDSDMVFIRPLPLDALQLDETTVSFDRVGYLDPDRDVYQPHIDQVFRESGVEPATIRNPVINGGVPHIVAAGLRKRFADEWLECIERFPIVFEGERPDSDDDRYADWPYRCYLASMWAIVMATHRMSLQYIETQWCMNNCHDDCPMPDPGSTGFCLVHYAYGSQAFDKRALEGDKCVSDKSFWRLAEDDGTIAGYLRRQVNEAGRFYGLC